MISIDSESYTVDLDMIGDKDVFQHMRGAWFFYDETGDACGPYTSEHEARIASLEYCHLELDGGFEYRWRKRLYETTSH